MHRVLVTSGAVVDILRRVEGSLGEDVVKLMEDDGREGGGISLSQSCRLGMCNIQVVINYETPSKDEPNEIVVCLLAAIDAGSIGFATSNVLMTRRLFVDSTWEVCFSLDKHVFRKTVVETEALMTELGLKNDQVYKLDDQSACAIMTRLAKYLREREASTKLTRRRGGGN